MLLSLKRYFSPYPQLPLSLSISSMTSTIEKDVPVADAKAPVPFLQNLKWTSTIPSNLAPGNYLIRHELLALHQANTPQFYPECAQLVVTGSGTVSAPADHLYSIPAYASASDPGVDVSFVSSYLPPGGTTFQIEKRSLM